MTVSGTAQVRLAMNRFGLGARPGEIGAVADAATWLSTQLTTTRGAPLVPGIDASPVRVKAVSHGLPPGDILARMTLQVGSPAPFLERLAMFWSNHFAVSATKNAVAPLVVPYENEVIRPNVNATFRAMLRASATHPAMLIFLSLNDSVGPDSAFGRPWHRTYNENYARELLELHTVGVDAGYTPADIDQVALALTGWHVDKASGLGVYDPTTHEPGARMVMGATLAAGDAQIEPLMSFLANHPATVRRICTKLAAHFVADVPPAATVAAMTQAWGRDGNLPAVYAALLGSDDAWQPAPQKFKPPDAFLISAARALAFTSRSHLLWQQSQMMGDPPLAPPSPRGFADDTVTWLTAAAVLARLDAASAIASFAPKSLQPVAVAAELLALDPASHTLDAMQSAASRTEAFALLLASPEFQRR